MSTGTEQRSGIAEAVARGLDFLDVQQLPSGQFSLFITQELTPEKVTLFDSSPFATAMIVYSLGFSDAPAARAIIARSVAYLGSELEPPGVWRHFSPDNVQQYVIPPDLDDTALVCHALAQHGEATSNHELFLANRDRRGRFYTWITPHWRSPTRNLDFWRVALRRWHHPLKSQFLWRRYAWAPDDVDAVVNANVLLYLGDGPHAGPVVEYLSTIVRRGLEDRSDKWYHDPLVFHYALARLVDAGIGGLEPIREQAIARVRAAANADGSIGSHVLDTALAACALHAWGAEGPELVAARAFLLEAQHADGGWPSGPMYNDSPWAAHTWGSRELTTGFCLEAILR
jgi:hypothetical protein